MVQEQDKANKLMVVLKSPRREDRLSGGFAEAKTRAKVLLQGKDWQAEAGDELLKQEEPLKALVVSDDRERERAYRQGNWVLSSIIILLEAKRKELDMSAGSRRTSISADEKWKFIEEYCRSRGVQRTKEQCKIKWDNMQPDYRKIKEYEEHRDPVAPSYFEMDSWDRRAKLLPSNMDVEVYQRIADIHCNKPLRGGGLKREAREKKFQDMPLILTKTFANGAFEGSDDPDSNGDRRKPESSLPVSAFVGKCILSPPLPPRRRKRKALERASLENRHDESESADDSSTEEDNTFVIASRFQPPSATQTGVFDDRSMAPSQRMAFECRDTSSLSDKEAPSGQQMTERSDEDGAFETRRERTAGTPELTSKRKDFEMLSYIQDRKDARHKELLALEREKLAAFREASFAIANAMSSAVAAFSKVAEEALLRRR